MAREATNLLLTGRPGIGKTTVLRRAAEALLRDGLELRGFFTEEMRADGRRVGFRGKVFGGEERVISHVGFEGGPNVGRYGVDVGAVEALAAEALSSGAPAYAVDEIGKMECLSERFVDRMRDLLDEDSPVVATIGRRGRGFMAETRDRPDARLVEVTEGNRDALPERVVDWVVASRRDSSG